jgi:hypothetical protein
MTERIEDILMEAHAVGMRAEVMDRAREIRDKHPYMELIDSYSKAYHELVESKL